MKVKVSDYIVNFLEKNGINTLFSITGGFAMHLNDSFGINKNFEIYYQHHEQACGYSAIGHSKSTSKPVVVCTTAGVAATNAISPCLIAHQDSLPILFISGQVKSTESLRKINTDEMKLRHYAGADCDIISMVTPITKYCKEILDVTELQDMLIKTVDNLINGRPGPVWLSIPVDIQGMLIDEMDIPIIKKEIFLDLSDITTNLDKVHSLLSQAKRPLIIAGNGIKLGDCIDKFNTFITKYNIPSVVTILSTDLIETDSNLYAGKIGLIGDRHGNFTLQNCDLLISLGCRMAQGLVGYRSDWFAREAKIIYIDNDTNELQKTNLNYDLKLDMNLNAFFDNYNYPTYDYNQWLDKCLHWKNKWIFEMPLNLTDEYGINPYFALKHLYDMSPENKITMCAAGSIVTVVWHMVKIKKNDKFLHSSQGDMGFEIPASIGAQIAMRDKMIITIVGEGSLQLNIQELQTIVHHKLPIKIFVSNNNAYGAIQITQTNFFKNKFGVDTSSGISFPSTEKLANAYGIKYLSVKKNEDVQDSIQQFLDCKETVILEVFTCVQGRYPRLNAIKNDDGTFTNRPFEDMDPFMDREEFKKEMIVKLV
jgi:acetolactate synthase-1/2/3 large subunit